MTTLRVAVLNCGYTVPSVLQARGQYHDVFASILQPAVERRNGREKEKEKAVRLVVEGYDAVQQTYPATLDGIDAVIISGSPSGAYEAQPWIERLLCFVRDLYANHPSVKLYGSCFGHQVVCAALYGGRGAVVRKDPAGYELGVQRVALSPAFGGRFGRFLPGGGESSTDSSPGLRLQFLHGDHVLLPDGEGVLPPTACVVGSTPHCAVQGVYEPGRLLTLQGHPEFDAFINTECLRMVGARVGWSTDATAAAVAAAQAADDAAAAADVMVAFFLGED